MKIFVLAALLIGNFTGDFVQEAEHYRAFFVERFIGTELRWSHPVTITWRSTDPLKASQTNFSDGNLTPDEIILNGEREHIIKNILPHEVLHTVLWKGYKLPRWADEGICTQVETPEERNHHHAFLSQRSKGIPFRQIVQMSEYPEDVGLFYSQSHVMVEFLLSIDPDPKTFYRFIHDDCNLRHYGLSGLGEFSQRWEAYYGRCKGRNCPNGPVDDMRTRDPWSGLNPPLPVPPSVPPVTVPPPLIPVPPTGNPPVQEQGTGTGTGTKEQGTGTGTKEQGTGTKEQGTGTKEPEPKEKEKEAGTNIEITNNFDAIIEDLLKSSLLDKLLYAGLGAAGLAGGWKLYAAVKGIKLAGTVIHNRRKRRRKKPLPQATPLPNPHDTTKEDRNADGVIDQTTGDFYGQKTTVKYVRVPTLEKEGEAYRKAIQKEVEYNPSFEFIASRIEAGKDAILHGMNVVEQKHGQSVR